MLLRKILIILHHNLLKNRTKPTNVKLQTTLLKKIIFQKKDINLNSVNIDSNKLSNNNIISENICDPTLTYYMDIDVNLNPDILPSSGEDHPQQEREASNRLQDFTTEKYIKIQGNFTKVMRNI